MAVIRELMERMVDLKSISRPPSFGGKEPEWAAWKFRFTHVLSLLGMGELLTRAEATADPITMNGVTQEVRDQSTLLYTILVQTRRHVLERQ